jgi:hypothetical protein
VGNGGSSNGGSGGTSAAGSSNAGSSGSSPGGSGPGGSGGSSGEAGSAGQAQGGSGGAAGSGEAGSGGSGGTAATHCATAAMIDDFEGGSDNICVSEGRSGKWYVYTDSGSITPSGSPVYPQELVPPIGASTLAMHFVSSGSANSFPSLGFSLVGMGAQALPFDASGYTGIRFRASSTLFDDFFLVVQTTATETTAYGGSCVSSCMPNQRYSLLFQDWNQYEFAFSEFADGSAAMVSSEIRSFTFRFHNDTDVWIDDIEFY